MTADLWIPGIRRVPPTGQAPIPLGLQGKGLRLFTWHSFEAPYSYSRDGIAAARYLNSQRSTSHFVFHPTTGALVQLLPANVGARTLRANGPSQHTNAFGSVHMQVETIAYAARPFTLDLTREGIDALTTLMNFLRAWGIPDRWSFQRPPAYPGPGIRRGAPSRSGHTHHAGWWANDHGDPGAIADPWAFTLNPTRPDPVVTRAQELINKIGAWGELVVDGINGPLTTAAVKAAQADLGVAVDGVPGPITNTALEGTMNQLDELLAEVRAIRAEQSKTPARTASAVWSTLIKGYHASFWIRGGSLGTDTDHPRYPADPGHLFDLVRRIAAKVLGPELEPLPGKPGETPPQPPEA